jgi:hypothetical protein
MQLLITVLAGFVIAFGVGWLCRFSYQTDWLASLVLSSAFYLSIQAEGLRLLALQLLSQKTDS